MNNKKSFYIIYKITNKINNKFYIGIHKTTDINDNYWGSGLNLKAAIKKYGVHNFKKTILHIFLKRKDAFYKEKGYGGFHHIRNCGKHKSCKNRKVMHDPDTNKNYKIPKEEVEIYILKGFILGPSTETKQKMSMSGKKKIQSTLHRLKNSNSKKGTTVLRNLTTNKCKFVKHEHVDEYIKNGWKKNCRKIKQ